MMIIVCLLIPNLFQQNRNHLISNIQYPVESVLIKFILAGGTPNLSDKYLVSELPYHPEEMRDRQDTYLARTSEKNLLTS